MPERLHPGVYVEEVPSGVRPIEGVGTSTAAFIGITEKGPVGEATFVTSWTQFETNFGSFIADSYLAYAVLQFFNNGGRKCYIVRVTKGDEKTASVNIPDSDGATTLVVSASSPGAWANDIDVVIEDPSSEESDEFKLRVVRDSETEEAFDNLSLDSSKSNYFVNEIKGVSNYITVLDDPTSTNRPANATYDLGSTTSGADGGTPKDADYQGDASEKTGFHALDDKNDVNIITVPGITSNAVIGKGFSYCKKRKDCFFIADIPYASDTPTEAKDFVRNTLTTKNSYGAIYYPWIKATDPIGTGESPTKELPPSGFIAGMYARIDGTRGVWKAPAGTEAGVAGALGLTYNATDTEQDILNPFAINCLRSFPASGIVIWGTRTLSPDAEWRYIPVRRYAIFLEQSIYYGTQWAVFEPNDEDLWASLRMNIRAFMMIQFREGALQGSTPSKAFYVKCDADLNPQSEIDAGRVNMEIGFFPLKPAEFVIIKITQKAGQQQ